MCHLRLNLWLQKLTETLWSLWPVELPGVPLWIILQILILIIQTRKWSPLPEYTSEKSGWRFAVFPAKGLKDDKFTARKHTRPVGRPHGQFYSSAIDVHSPMRAGEWNFTPLCSIITPTFISLRNNLVIGQLNEYQFFSAFHWSTSGTPPASQCITVQWPISKTLCGLFRWPILHEIINTHTLNNMQ